MSELASEPRKFGEYEVESVLGKGAMGMVYLARDRRIGRRVALKTVQVNQQFEDASEATEFFQRLQREAEVCGAMQHPNIVTLYEPGYENNVISYLATEYVDGESLRDRLKRAKPNPLPQDEALRIGEDILRGLAYAHAKGVIHRDVKPANILLSADGQAKIADFGIARPANSDLTVAGSMLGTPNYMSPEQVRCAPVTTRSDLFAVGVVLYEMLTGAKPFAAGDVSGILRNVVELEPPLASAVNPDVPEPIAKLVARLLAKEPQQRYESAAEALAELQTLCGKTPATIPTLVLPPPPSIDAPPHGIDAATSTIAAGSASKPLDGTTDKVFDDATPAITAPKPMGLISTPLFYTIVALCIAAFLGAVVVIRAETNRPAAAVMTGQQLAEFALKKNLLATAQTLVKAGRYDDAIVRYDALLKQYPNSIAAQNGRAEALAQIEAHKARATVTTKASKARPKSQEQQEPQKKPSLWQRMFHRNRSK